MGDTVTNSIESHVHFLSLSKRKKFRHIFNSAINLFSFNNGGTGGGVMGPCYGGHKISCT